MNDKKYITDFAPYDYTDGREPLDWKSRYTDKQARLWIILETIYLLIFLFAVPIIIFLLWTRKPNFIMLLNEIDYKIFVKYGFAWLGGVLGGTLYCIKWLYHSIAKSIWHLDRRIWRFLTPHLSGAIGFTFMVIINSNIIRIFDSNSFNSPWVFFSIGFIIGYFSDSATAKLAELARILFGISERHNGG